MTDVFSVHRRRIAQPLLLTFGAILLVACGSSTAVNCSTIANFGLEVTVVDASTQVAAPGVPSLTVTEGSYTETYAAPNATGSVPTFHAAVERPGTYALTVTLSGYRPFTRSGLVVSKGGACNQVQTVAVKAAMIQLAN